MIDITETIVSKPIETEIAATERVIKNRSPQLVRDRSIAQLR